MKKKNIELRLLQILMSRIGLRALPNRIIFDPEDTMLLDESLQKKTLNQ